MHQRVLGGGGIRGDADTMRDVRVFALVLLLFPLEEA